MLDLASVPCVAVEACWQSGLGVTRTMCCQFTSWAALAFSAMSVHPLKGLAVGIEGFVVFGRIAHVPDKWIQYETCDSIMRNNLHSRSRSMYFPFSLSDFSICNIANLVVGKIVSEAHFST